ncbi:MAG: mechanosensitive ion channel family protein [Bacilli bacterium]|nr:mechanosensitive ion channel family protein [Bacilli bacterium]
MEEKKSNLKLMGLIINLVIDAIFLAFVIIIACRKFVFKPDSLLYNLYEEDFAKQTDVRILKTVVIIAACAVSSEVGKWVAKLGTVVKNNTVKTTLLLVGNVAKYLAFILILLLSLSAWGVDTAAIVTGAGVLTLVISLGCQQMVSDIVAGIFMLFEGDIKVGDVVVVNGWRGTVQQIGLRRTRIQDAAGNINIVNNASISNIINNTQDLSVAICDVGIEYNESIERVEKVLSEAFPKMKEELPAIVKGPYYKGVAELGASSVVIRIIAQVKEEDLYQTQRDMNRFIKILFDKNNINIPFSQVVVNYRDEEEAQKVTLSDKAKAKKFVEKQNKESKEFDDVDVK